MKIPAPVLISVSFIGIVAASYVVFQGDDLMPVTIVPAVAEPSMIPGAEAVRPLAANQSLVAENILSELVNPAPASQPLPEPPPAAEIQPVGNAAEAPAPVTETAS